MKEILKLNRQIFIVTSVFVMFLSPLLFISCENEDYPYFVKVENEPVSISDCINNNPDIPQDPGGLPPSTAINNVSPYGTFSKNVCRIMINLLGIIDPATNQPVDLFYNSNVFVTEDGILKGLKVTNLQSQLNNKYDLVFIVDNSGSMGEEADTIASKALAFVQFLQNKGVDLKVGVVGYDEMSDISGALNLSDGNQFGNYLNRPGRFGIQRTYDFYGTDSADIEMKASSFNNEIGENGIVAISFADSFFSWRANATRIYINFTDEGIQSLGQTDGWNISNFVKTWHPSKGSIHTVFSVTWTGMQPDTSSSVNGFWSENNERPWQLSQKLGGTVKFVYPDARDLDLTTLPVTQAITNSALIEYISTEPYKPHNVVVIIKDVNKNIDGRTEYINILY